MSASAPSPGGLTSRERELLQEWLDAAGCGMPLRAQDEAERLLSASAAARAYIGRLQRLDQELRASFRTEVIPETGAILRARVQAAVLQRPQLIDEGHASERRRIVSRFVIPLAACLAIAAVAWFQAGHRRRSRLGGGAGVGEPRVAAGSALVPASGALPAEAAPRVPAPEAAGRSALASAKAWQDGLEARVAGEVREGIAPLLEQVAPGSTDVPGDRGRQELRESQERVMPSPAGVEVWVLNTDGGGLGDVAMVLAEAGSMAPPADRADAPAAYLARSSSVATAARPAPAAAGEQVRGLRAANEVERHATSMAQPAPQALQVAQLTLRRWRVQATPERMLDLQNRLAEVGFTVVSERAAPTPADGESGRAGFDRDLTAGSGELALDALALYGLAVLPGWGLEAALPQSLLTVELVLPEGGAAAGNEAVASPEATAVEAPAPTEHLDEP